MSMLKAPEPDGYQPVIYQRTWSITVESMISYVRWLFGGESSPGDAVDALLVLVPKIDKPSKINQFRHISLCNANYKITTKVISNRLKEVWKDIISPNQASFIQER